MRHQSNGQGESGLARGRRAAGDIRWWQDDCVVYCHHEPPLSDPSQQMWVGLFEGIDVDTVMLSGICKGNFPGQLERREANNVRRKCGFRFHAAYWG